MGIDLHNLNLLAYAQDRGVRFDRTLAIGRQGVFIDPPEFEHHRRIRRSPPLAEPGVPRYFEPLMTDWFGATIADAGRYVSQITIPAKEVAQRTNLHCVVAGPVEREVCVKLFTDPRMQTAFAAWKKQ